MIVNKQEIKIQKVILKIYEKDLTYKQYCYEKPGYVTIGRDPKSDIQLDIYHTEISREQCVFEIHTNHVCIRDCGSRNGTYLNGILIGKRETEEVKSSSNMKSYYVSNGDIVLLGEEKPIKILIEIEKTIYHSKIDQIEQLEENEQDVIEEEIQEEIQNDSFIPEPTPEKGIKYRLGKRLGSGQLGNAVYKIKGDDKKVIKLFAPLQDSISKIRFEREAKIGCMLSHPNLIKSYQYGYRWNHRPYIVMEAGSGITLEQFRMKMESYLTPMVCVDIILIVLDVLQYLHSVVLHIKKEDGTNETIKGIIHRDIKPKNILVNEDSDSGEFEIKVTDLGIIKLMEVEEDLEITKEFTVGTYAYMAREQVMDSSQVSPRVDVWAAAAVLFFLLTGEEPREKSSNDEDIHYYSARKIRTVNPNVPKALAEIIDRTLLENDGKERIETAKEFIHLLEKWEEAQG